MIFFCNLVASTGGWDLIALNAKQCLDVKMENVLITQTHAFVIQVGKEHFVMNLIVGKCKVI